MSVPDRLYLSKGIYNTFMYQVPNPDDKTEVEYIHADTFIEKVWSWIEDNILSSNQQDKSLLYYEQFKNYLKGE